MNSMTSTHRFCSTAAILVLLSAGSAALGQVKIDMPPPPKPASAPIAIASGPADENTPEDATIIATSGDAVVVSHASRAGTAVNSSPKPDVGLVALVRYSQYRTGTRDTYFNDGMYWDDGVRVYSYPRYFPQYVWGPWWGWGGWGFGHICW